MIHHPIVTHATALLLEQAGFPQEEQCKHYIDREGEGCLHCGECESAGPAAPDIYQAMNWLRERFEMPLDIVAVPRNGMIVDNEGVAHPRDGWAYAVVHTTLPLYDTYEQAAEAGISSACEYIIHRNRKQ